MASVVESTERALSEVEQGSAQGLLDNRNGSEDLVVNEDEQVFQAAPTHVHEQRTLPRSPRPTEIHSNETRSSGILPT